MNWQAYFETGTVLGIAFDVQNVVFKLPTLQRLFLLTLFHVNSIYSIEDFLVELLRQQPTVPELQSLTPALKDTETRWRTWNANHGQYKISCALQDVQEGDDMLWQRLVLYKLSGLSDEEGTKEMERLRCRDLILLCTLVMARVALHADAQVKDVLDDMEPAKKSTKIKKSEPHPTVLLDQVIDRLCVVHEMAQLSTPNGGPIQDEIESFHALVLKHMTTRLPSVCQSFTLKLYGEVQEREVKVKKVKSSLKRHTSVMDTSKARHEASLVRSSSVVETKSRSSSQLDLAALLQPRPKSNSVKILETRVVQMDRKSLAPRQLKRSQSHQPLLQAAREEKFVVKQMPKVLADASPVKSRQNRRISDPFSNTQPGQFDAIDVFTDFDRVQDIPIINEPPQKPSSSLFIPESPQKSIPSFIPESPIKT